MTLKQLKAQATRTEHNRVYGNFGLPPRDITVEHEGGIYVRRAWQSGRTFGWNKWEKAA